MSKFKRYERYKDSGVEWIGEVPEHWSVIKLKYVAKLAYGDSLPTENREEEGEVDVFGSNGKVGTHNVANTLSPVIIVGRKGSYGKVTYSDKKCFAIDTTYYIDNRCTKSNIKWLYHSLMILELDKNSQDTGVPGLSREYAYNKYVPVPTVNEQAAIANFLEQKTAEIDGLIADKEKLIELLQEKRQAIITEAVTKGLNPNVRMKDSGIEWIGEIPEEWELIKIKFVGTIYSGNGFKEELQGKTEGDYPFFKVSDINGNGKLAISSNNYVDEDDVVNNGWNIIPKNSILFPKIGEALKKNHRKINACSCLIDNNIAAIKTNERIIDFNYFYYYFCCVNAEWFVNPGAVPSINNAYLKNFMVLLPSKNEQTAIANFLDQKTAEIDDLITEIKLQIQKLKEYRQSLISEAVTGKIDVREFQNKNEVIFRNE
jgi:type I restriction enzyme, S subunit